MGEKVDEFVLTTEIINEIEEKENYGKLLKRYENTSAGYLTLAHTSAELKDIHHKIFANDK